ncbi:hypothetical protein QYE76_068712 [Lolium multiflorum]|uniref:DUF4216 domain-containing protein n=1 Tax=Lolium multiflorum TaxID=4521 RepID=A0AAD8SGT7_LOLMU|nr:hypothetical protein QYE76_068712 [Lolium multiflorum]
MENHYILYLKLDMEDKEVHLKPDMDMEVNLRLDMEVNLRLDMEVNLRLDMEVMQGHTMLVEVMQRHTIMSEPQGAGKDTIFAELIEEAKRAASDGGTMSRFSLTVKLLQAKSYYRISNVAFNAILLILALQYPNSSIPKSYEEALSIVGRLGLGYESIHVCPNNCVLFRKDYAKENNCPKCKASRWKDADGRRKIPEKVLRHFPLIPRLQRMFLSKEQSKEVQWHKLKRQDVENDLSHPADGDAWKDFDNIHKDFAADARNIRLGLATDGFNPYGNMSNSYSMWPVFVVPYNLPPWACMDQSNFMLALLIPGPSSPGKDFDVFMEPLMEELQELWKGVKSLCKQELNQQGGQINVDRWLAKNFARWFQTHIGKMRNDVCPDLYALACKPDFRVRLYSACVVDSVRYHTVDREKNRKTQNSGIVSEGDHDGNSIDFFGQLKSIIRLQYNSSGGVHRSVVLFRCDWFDLGGRKPGLDDDGHFKSVNTEKFWYKTDPFLLTSQATKDEAPENAVASDQQEAVGESDAPGQEGVGNPEESILGNLSPNSDDASSMDTEEFNRKLEELGAGEQSDANPPSLCRFSQPWHRWMGRKRKTKTPPRPRTIQRSLRYHGNDRAVVLSPEEMVEQARMDLVAQSDVLNKPITPDNAADLEALEATRKEMLATAKKFANTAAAMLDERTEAANFVVHFQKKDREVDESLAKVRELEKHWEAKVKFVEEEEARIRREAIPPRRTFATTEQQPLATPKDNMKKAAEILKKKDEEIDIDYVRTLVASAMQQQSKADTSRRNKYRDPSPPPNGYPRPPPPRRRSPAGNTRPHGAGGINIRDNVPPPRTRARTPEPRRNQNSDHEPEPKERNNDRELSPGGAGTRNVSQSLAGAGTTEETTTKVKVATEAGAILAKTAGIPKAEAKNLTGPLAGPLHRHPAAEAEAEAVAEDPAPLKNPRRRPTRCPRTPQ